jgi:phosphoethanolamine N-methyltransferase
MVPNDSSVHVDVAGKDSGEVRRLMRDYWDQWVEDKLESGTFLEPMIGERNLEKALEFHELDRNEVLKLLPDYTDMDVLELGAGSGRYSGELAKKAKFVEATDFMESFVKQNEITHGSSYPNMKFRTLDAAKLDYPPNSFDLIFSNWLLMYLNNEDTGRYAYNNLMMLRPGGFTFFRESHFRPAGVRSQSVNPTIYRSLMEYQNFFSSARYTDDKNDTYFFELVYAGNCQTYVQQKGNPAQVYYLWRKTKVTPSPSIIDIQKLLDTNLYNEENMSVYDGVIGDGFTTPGGLTLTKDLVAKLNLQPNSVVLDAGCGLGRLLEYLIKDLDMEAIGLELSMQASQSAILRLNPHKLNKGLMRIADAAHTNFAPNSFDAIYGRETIQYLGNKSYILNKTLAWLKPGGRLMIGDYCLQNVTNGTAALVKSEGLNIVTVEGMMTLLKDAGYTDIKFEDYSHRYIDYLKSDIAKLSSIQGISDTVRGNFLKLWKSFVTALEEKELVWVVFTGTKGKC